MTEVKLNIGESKEDKQNVVICHNSPNHDILKELCLNNAEFFVKDDTENGHRLYIAFLAIKDNIDYIWPKVESLKKIVAQYDFDENTPGNGYRSFLSVVDSAIVHGIQLNKRILLKRDSLLFRKTVLTKELESCSHLLSSLDEYLKHLITLTKLANEGELFPKENAEEHVLEEFLSKAGDVNQHCFYGRSLGFQYCESIRNILKFVSLSMAIFSEAYYSQGSLFSKATNSVMSTTKYITDPEQRAKRIVNISQNADVDFCKAFWFLSESELMHHVPSMVATSVAVSKIICIPPEPLTLNVDGKEIEIPIPTSHIGKKSIQVRLISHEVRDGMVGEGAAKLNQPPSRGLLFHCHGGGFVAQSSRSHECYLREWAKELQVPILSIDYSLAPQAPFPRALEEIFYAYCWTLKNSHLLGSTGERIVGAGDSAGANLLLALSLKSLDMGVPLLKGLFLAYTPTLVDFIPSPARLLCLMDPLLPFGFLMRCLKAYACPDPKLINGESLSDTESFEEISESDFVELQAHKSPVSETSDTLTYGSLSSPTVEEKEQNTIKEMNISEIELNSSDLEGNSSQKCVSDFLEKYVLDSDTETDGTKIPVLRTDNTPLHNSDSSLQSKVSSFMANLKGRINNFVGVSSPSRATLILDSKERNLGEEFKFYIPRNPYLSPYCASDEALKQLPPIKILTVHMDPCLDDCVMFAKKIKKLGNDVKLDILDGLPHGFLNFNLVCKEAFEGSKLCAQRISELLKLDSLPPKQQ